MAATTAVNVYHGPVNNQVLTPLNAAQEVRFKRADDDNANTQAPIPIPLQNQVGVTNYSWVKRFRLIVTQAPASTIQNLRFYQTGSFGTGITHWIATSSSYVQGSVADETQQIGGATNAANTSAVAPFVIHQGVVFTTGTDSTPGPGTGQEFLLQQIGVDNTASPGITQNQPVFHYLYDEF